MDAAEQRRRGSGGARFSRPRLSALRAVFLLCFLAWSVARTGGEEAHPEPLPLQSPAPDFHLPGVDGSDHALADFAGSNVLVVVFTCNHCPTAQAYEDRLKQLAAEYGPRSVALVAISPNDPKSVRLDELGYTDLSDSFAEMKIRARDRRFNFPYLFDGQDEKVSRAYGPAATPQAFVFDRDRRLRYAGRIDDSEREPLVKTRDLRNALDDLLGGRDLRVKETKSFGCSIKWAGKEEAVKAYLAKLAAEPVRIEEVGKEGLKALRQNSSGKLRLVNFWATWCGPCITEFPELVTINRMYRHRAFEMVTVSANFPDERKEVQAFLEKQQASGRNLLFGSTEKYELMASFDPAWNNALPYTALINPAGEIIYKAQGEIDPLEIKRAIVKSLQEDRFK